MSGLGIEAWLPLNIVDNLLSMLIFFRFVNWNVRKYPLAFWSQVLLMGSMDAIWNSYFDYDENRIWINTLIMIVCTTAFMPRYRLRAFAGVLMTKVFEVLSELVYAAYLAFVAGVDLSTVNKDFFTVETTLQLAGTAYLVKLILLLIFQRTGFKLFKQEVETGKGERGDEFRKYRYSLLLLIVVIVSQLFFYFIWVSQGKVSSTVFVSVVSAISAVFAMIFILMKQADAKEQLVQKQELLTWQETQLDQVQTLFTALRAERHDFVNHVQVLQGLVHSGSIDEADKYLGLLASDVRTMHQVLVKDHPLLSALLQVKMAQCAREGIELDIQLMDPLRDVHWRSTEMITLIGNVVNNAIEAFLESHHVNSDERKIWLRSRRVGNGLVELVIGNNADPISTEMLHRIQEVGVTSKKGHSGIGLASVAQIVARIHGRMDVQSDREHGTQFLFTLKVG